MPDRLWLRPMTEDEFLAFGERSRREYAVELAATGAMSPEAAAERSAREFARLLPEGVASPAMYLWTAVVGGPGGNDDAGQPVGLAWLELRRTESGVSAWIFDVHVDEDRRGQGIGRQTMEALHEAARALGATTIGLNVFGHNTTAIGLYESLGYRVTSQEMRRDL